MNVAYILNSTGATEGSIKAFFNMINGLGAYDVCPFVILPNSGGVCKMFQNSHKTLVVNYRSSIYSHRRNFKEKMLFLPRMAAKLAVNWLATRQITKFLRDNDIDIVHTNTSTVDVGYRAAKKLGIPHIYHVREFDDFFDYYPNSNAQHQNLIDSYCICITRAIANHYSLNTDKMRVVYDGVFGEFSVRPKPQRRDFLFFAGRIQYIKGVDILINAYVDYAKLVNNPLKLYIAGYDYNDGYSQHLHKIVTDNKLDEQVIFLGEIADIEQYLTKAKATIISSRTEGFGFCMVEAMQNGSIAIVHDIGGLHEQLENAIIDEVAPIALSFNQREELTHLLVEVANNPISHYKEMQERAYNLVTKRYTIEQNAKEIYMYYNDILDKQTHNLATIQ